MKITIQDRNEKLSKLLKGFHENKWVAIAPDYSRILAAAATLQELSRAVSDSDAIFHRVLPLNVSFVPLFS